MRTTLNYTDELHIVLHKFAIALVTLHYKTFPFLQLTIYYLCYQLTQTLCPRKLIVSQTTAKMVRNSQMSNCNFWLFAV